MHVCEGMRGREQHAPPPAGPEIRHRGSAPSVGCCTGGQSDPACTPCTQLHTLHGWVGGWGCRMECGLRKRCGKGARTTCVRSRVPNTAGEKCWVAKGRERQGWLRGPTRQRRGWWGWFKRGGRGGLRQQDSAHARIVDACAGIRLYGREPNEGVQFALAFKPRVPDKGTHQAIQQSKHCCEKQVPVLTPINHRSCPAPRAITCPQTILSFGTQCDPVKLME